MRLAPRSQVFFLVIFLLTLLQTKLFFGSMDFDHVSLLIYLWAGVFMILSFNISILAVQSLFAVMVKSPSFNRVQEIPVASSRAALLYCIRNESYGLFERIRYTFGGNQLPSLDLFILSDSDEAFEAGERELVEKLTAEFGAEKIFYRRRNIPYERKQGNIKDWLLCFGGTYDYFILCDADSLLPPGWAEESLQIASHPDQADVAVFQSAIYVTHEASLYARMQAIAQYYSQRFYFRVNQAVLGRSIAFGHNCLIRRGAFEKIELPQGILSHDNWETALLEQAGYRSIFLPDLISYEEAAPHYLEDRKRARRWLKGSLQGLPLLFLPKISLAARFLIFYQIYLYLVQPLLFFWIAGGFFVSTSSHYPLLTPGFASFSLLFLTLSVLFFHKFVAAQHWRDGRRILQETAFSTLVGLQNIFYGTLDFLSLPFEKLKWIPMAKNPDDEPSFSDCLKQLLPGTAVGLFAIWMGIQTAPSWTLYSLPVLTSLIFSIPAVYLSAKSKFAAEVTRSIPDEEAIAIPKSLIPETVMVLQEEAV